MSLREVEVEQANDLHQSDFVGPCFLKGGLRFYSFHSVDLATGRCAVEPVIAGKEESMTALWGHLAPVGPSAVSTGGQ
jgi:hypothetical protein